MFHERCLGEKIDSRQGWVYIADVHAPSQCICKPGLLLVNCVILLRQTFLVVGSSHHTRIVSSFHPFFVSVVSRSQGWWVPDPGPPAVFSWSLVLLVLCADSSVFYQCSGNEGGELSWGVFDAPTQF